MSRSLSPNDEIIVVGRETGETRGVFVAASAASLVMAVGGRRHEVPAAEIVTIDKRGDPVWGGGIVGGAIMGLAFMGGAGASCSPNCDRDVPRAAAGGAALGFGIGAAIDYLHRGQKRVYTAPRGLPPAPAAAEIGAPAATEPAPAPGSFATLWERVRPGDPVSIALTDGREVDGRFRKASTAVIAVGTQSGAQEFSADHVRRVVRKSGGTHAMQWMLIGAPVGALFGSGSCYRVEPILPPEDPGVSCGAAVLLGTGAGAAAGYALGRTVWRRTVVYEAPSAAVRSGRGAGRSARGAGWIVAPLVSRRSIGIAGSLMLSGR